MSGGSPDGVLTFLWRLAFEVSLELAPSFWREVSKQTRSNSSRAKAKRMEIGMFRWSSTRRMFPAACLLTLGLSVSCSTENKQELSREPQIVYETIKDPIAEMCTDDSGARTEYINFR
jgi:hypothetical protein